jgi:hypothetical protein
VGRHVGGTLDHALVAVRHRQGPPAPGEGCQESVQ